MGSKKHLLLGMVTRRNRAFYNFGKLVRLDRIPPGVWMPYLNRGFAGIGFKPAGEVTEMIVKEAGNIPFYVQYLAFEVAVCAMISGLLTEETVTRALERMMINQEDYFRALWESVSYTQQQTLLALARENRGIYSKGYLDRNKLYTVSGVQRSVAVLMKKGIIDKSGADYMFEDPFFAAWLRRNGGEN
jgi:hypothetical protein